LFVVGELLHRPFACSDLAISVVQDFLGVRQPGRLLEAARQDHLGLLEIPPLAPAMLDDDGCSGGTMDDPNGRVGLVAVLATFAAAAVREDIYVLIGYLDHALTPLCDDGNGRRCGVTTPPAVVFGDPLDSVHAGQTFIGAAISPDCHFEGSAARLDSR
jgi:hypothetical protein